MAYSSVFNVAERIGAIPRNDVNLVGGIEKVIKRLVDELQSIRYVVDDAEKRRFADNNVNIWLTRLHDTANEMEDVLDEWEEKMEPESNDAVSRPKQKVCPSFLSCCFCCNKQVTHHEFATKILNLKKQFDEIFMERERFNFAMSRRYDDLWTELLRAEPTATINLPIELFGRDKDRDFLVSKLIMSNGGSEEELGLRILTIVGMCGIGKTALARIVYDDIKVEDFFELRIWIRVSGEIKEGIIKWVKEAGSCPSSTELDVVLECLRDCISGKKFLLVLDDVRTQDCRDWKVVKRSLDCGGAGSKILVTTRNEGVAHEIMGSTDSEMYHLKQLSSNDCWHIIHHTARHAVPHNDIFEELAINLPLTATLLGNLLGFKRNLQVREHVIWPSDKVEKMCFPCLSLIYKELPPALKDCFSYCAVFPKDYVINVERLIEYWKALGYFGPDIQGRISLYDVGPQYDAGREYINILANLSLFQDLEKSDEEDGQIKRFKMHDVVHDFAQFVRMNGRVDAGGTKKKTCQVCDRDPSLVSIVKEYRSLFITPHDEPPPSLCDCLVILRILSLRGSNFPSMPQEIEKLIHLRWLDLSEIKLSREDTKTVCKLYKLRFLRLSSCNLKEIPSEIGNLSGLRKLDLSFNYFLKGLPENICCLVELETLNLDCCHSFSKLPQGIHKLTKLEHLHNKDAHFLFKFPLGLGSLTSLRTLTKFHGGSHLNKPKLLRNLNSLSGSLDLHIRLSDDLLEDAREAELKDKQSIQDLKLTFYDYMDGKESSLRTEIIDALKPHQGLQKLQIRDSNGSTLPSWIISPQNKLRSIVLSCFNHLLSLPPLGELPHLEELRIDQMFGLQSVGREFLGITTETVSAGEDFPSTSTLSNMIGFPKLKKLIFNDCHNWEEWEDITTEEEKALTVQIMPCLTELSIKSCKGLRVLPLRLLHKASLLKVLDVSGSIQLQQHYDDDAWKSISQNPPLRIVL